MRMALHDIVHYISGELIFYVMVPSGVIHTGCDIITSGIFHEKI